MTNDSYVSPLGQIPTGWQLVKLKDLTTKIGSGSTPRGGSEVYLATRQNYALVRSQNVFDRHFDSNGLVYIPDEQAELMQSVKLQPNDILLNITGDGITFGRACIVPEDVLPACVNQHVSIIRVNQSQCSPGYVLAFLTHPLIKKYIESFNAGGSRRAVTKGHIEAFEIPLPSLPEQRAIASILSALDDKIELNRKMNQTLENIARTLFKSWFIDFDPVRANLENQPIPGLDPQLAALFPSSFQNSLIGEIPDGWEVKTLPQIIEINPYRQLSKGQLAPYLEMSNLSTTSYRILNWEYRELGSGMKFKNGDTLLARITPCLENGKTAFVDFLEDEEIGWGSTEYIVFRSKQPLPAHYSYLLARTDELRAHTIKNMSGTSGRQRASAECFNSFLTVSPSEKVARIFGDLVTPLFTIIKQKDEECRTLARIRDALLPKLLSDQLRVPEVEKLIKVAV